MTGLNLSKHYEDVVKIVHSKFTSYSLDPEDLVQDTCVKILKLNRGSSPYDPNQSSISTYIYMVAKGVALKTLRGTDPEDNYVEVLGFSEWNEAVLSHFEKHLKANLPFEDTLPRRVFLLLKMGYTREEISKLLDTSMYQVKKQKKRLVELAGSFMETTT